MIWLAQCLTSDTTAFRVKAGKRGSRYLANFRKASLSTTLNGKLSVAIHLVTAVTTLFHATVLRVNSLGLANLCIIATCWDGAPAPNVLGPAPSPSRPTTGTGTTYGSLSKGNGNPSASALSAHITASCTCASVNNRY